MQVNKKRYSTTFPAEYVGIQRLFGDDISNVTFSSMREGIAECRIFTGCGLFIKQVLPPTFINSTRRRVWGLCISTVFARELIFDTVGRSFTVLS